MFGRYGTLNGDPKLSGCEPQENEVKDHHAKYLRALVEADQKLSDANKTEVLADLRAEAFWNDRAPDLNDELLALRPLEAFARIIANGGELSADRRKDLDKALASLDAVRAAQAKKAKK